METLISIAAAVAYILLISLFVSVIVDLVRSLWNK